MPPRKRPTPPAGDDAPTDLRVIGGRFRGTRLVYEPHTDGQKGHPAMGKSARVTRPMKHRVREAIFNLIGPAVKGKHAIDLFAGTGALGVEAISRGAESATFIERHLPTARVVRANLEAVAIADEAELLVTSAFVWRKADLASWAAGAPQASRPWLVFISPPYAFFVDREAEMLDLVAALVDAMPSESIVVVEADTRFDFAKLPGGVRQDRHSMGWDVRAYAPAVVGVWRDKPEEEPA